MSLLGEIDTFIEAHSLSESQFGLLCMKDKHFVRQLREGRDIRMSTQGKVKQFMLTYASDRDSQC